MTDAPKLVPTEQKGLNPGQDGSPPAHKPETVGPVVETKPAAQPAIDKK